MKYLKDLHEGMRVSSIYLCKHRQSAVTKNGKPYENVILQDKTGTLDAKIWEPNSQGIDDFDSLDYIEVMGDVTSFAGALQMSIKRVRRVQEGEYDPADYLPVTDKNVEELYQTLLKYVQNIKNPWLLKLLQSFFVEDKEFIKKFRFSSAAKSVHHGFVGGLLEHTVSVAHLCEFFCRRYDILNHDLLITAALCHDIGKTRELSAFPENDYTDEGQLLGHIMMGSQMIHDRVREISGFPEKLERELIHCVLAHHGELEYGSPKKPALAEAVALNMADNTDAKMETLTEIFRAALPQEEWLGYNRLFESNLRRAGQ